MFLFIILINTGCSPELGATQDDREYQMKYFTSVIRIRDRVLTNTSSILNIYYSWHTPAYFTSKDDSVFYARVIDICDNVWYIKLDSTHMFDSNRFNVYQDSSNFNVLMPEIRKYYENNKGM